ncbi:hypothetical protein B0H13DRAFT_2301811 [Mycena leptocephala]|nr:hypothetical protein B0H13DRAFT_2301811 [Mycena leptocephala]
MAMSPLAIMHDGILFPVYDSTFPSLCATARLFQLESAAFFVRDSVPLPQRKAYWSHSVRNGTSFLCATAPSISAPRRVLPQVNQRPPFMGNSPVSFHVRNVPLIQSGRDGASFSCPTGLSAPLRLFPHVEHPSHHLLFVSDGAFTQRAIAPLSSCGTSFPAFTQCAIAPLSSCAILPVCDGIVPSCATAPSLVSDGALTQCHCASPPMRAGAFLDRLRWRTPFVHDDALISCRFFPRATVPPSRILLRARQHPPSSRTMAPSLLCNGTLIQCTIGPPFSYSMTLPWFARDSVLCSPLSPTFFARRAGTVSDVVLCTEAIHPSQAEVHPIRCSIALYRVQWCLP